MPQENQSIFSDPQYDDKKPKKSGKNSSAKRGLALFLAVLAVCLLGVGAYFAKKYIKPDEDYTETGKTIFSVSVDSIKSVKTEFSENTLEIKKKDKKWTCDGAESPDQSKLESFAKTCSEITVLKKMKKNDLDYGFSEPYGTVKVSSSEGDYTLVFGALIPDGYSRYVKIEGIGDDNVYLMLVSETEKFNKTAADMNTSENTSSDTAE